MPTGLRTPPYGLLVVWLLFVGGCVNLTPPWEGRTDAHAQSGGATGGGSTGRKDGSIGGSPAGNASGADANGAGGAGGSGRFDGDTPSGSGGAGGVAATGGNSLGGSGGTTATGGSRTLVDAQAPLDQRQGNDTINVPEVVPPRDAAREAEIDMPAGPDLATDSMALTKGLIAYYPCEQANGTVLPDLSGNGKNAVLTGTTSFAPGRVGKALVLSAASGRDAASTGSYATLPAGIVAGATEMTVAAWFNLTTASSFERIFDFGTSSTTSSMYLTPRNFSGLPQFTIRLGLDGGTQIKQDIISTGTVIAANAWHHAAIVLNAVGGHLYFDGVSVGNSTTMTFRPADLGAMPNNWIGRSEFVADPYFDGMIDEFRVYNRALTSDEVAALFAIK